jgi:hypothetical protein
MISLLWLGLLSADNLFALTTNNMETPQKLAETILGDGVTISNVTYRGAHDTAGTFDDGMDSIGIESGIVLSSGLIYRVVGPNLNDGMHYTDYSSLGDPELDALIPGNKTYDATVLEFDFVIDVVPGASMEPITIIFEYVFASEEYNEYVNDKFNDIFAFFVNGNNVALIPRTTTPIATGTVNSGNPYNPDSTMSTAAYYRNNDLSDGGGSIDIGMDGLTVILNARIDVIPGVLTHIKLAIADAGNYFFDSNVFIKPASFTVEVSDSEVNSIFNHEDNCSLKANHDQKDFDKNGI